MKISMGRVGSRLSLQCALDCSFPFVSQPLPTECMHPSRYLRPSHTGYSVETERSKISTNRGLPRRTLLHRSRRSLHPLGLDAGPGIHTSQRTWPPLRKDITLLLRCPFPVHHGVLEQTPVPTNLKADRRFTRVTIFIKSAKFK